MKILCTGGAGYIGSVLVPMLVRAGHSVTVLDNLMYGQTSLNALWREFRFVALHGDARDMRVLAPLLKSTDVLIPLAAIVGMPACDRDRHTAESTNFGAVLQAVQLMSSHQRVIYPNTNSGYGAGKDGICTEDDPLTPISHYGKTKMQAEQAVLAHDEAIVLRLATVFGMSPRMRLDLMVNDFVHRAIVDRAIVLYEPHFRRNFIHVFDVARAFLHAIRSFETMKGRPYNVGLSSANISKVSLCQQIRRQLPDFAITFADSGSDPDKRNYVVSNERIEATGYTASIALDEGIIELLRGLRFLPRGEFGNV